MRLFFAVSCILITVALLSCSQNGDETTEKDVLKAEPNWFYLVRHAEKVEDGTQDPDLTDKGKNRSALLYEMLKENPPAVIYSSPFKRCILTVQPLADSLGLEVTMYDPSDSPKLMDEIFEKHSGKSVLIVGHSNTIPGIANLLLWENKYPNLDESDYDKLFVVQGSKDAKGSHVVLNFSPDWAKE
jgi:2,3-bisphosphoglycerate-dependent phosphoglycerate mutase